MTDTIFFDLETRSRCDLRMCGAFQYVRHPSTEIMMISEAVNDGPVELVPLEDSQAYRCLRDDVDAILVCHNSSFDVSALLHRGGKKWENLQHSRCTVHDTLLGANILGLSPSLNGCAISLLGKSKLDAGTRLINKYAKPSKDGTFTPLSSNLEDKKLFEEYALRDTELLRQIYRIIHGAGVFTDTILKHFLYSQVINEYGLPMDSAAVSASCELITQELVAIDSRVLELTGGAVTSIRSIKTVLGFINSHPNNQERHLDSLTAESVRTALGEFTDPVLNELLLLRQRGALSSIRKIKKAAAILESSEDSRIRGSLLFYGAHTGRAAGRLIQPQNFPRGIGDTNFFNALENGTASLIYDDTLSTIKENLRGYVYSGPDEEFYCADYAQIEPRLLFYVAKEPALAMFSDGRDIYQEFAAKTFRVPAAEAGKGTELRRIGKAAILGLGYGMGPVRFQEVCEAQSLMMSLKGAEMVVSAYRSTFKAVISYWKWVEDVFRLQLARCTTRFLELPRVTGRSLFYDTVRVIGNDLVYQKKSIPTKLYGAKIVENHIQALAADLLMFATGLLMDRGFNPVLQCHDEDMVLQPCDNGRFDEFNEIMLKKPPWLDDTFCLEVESWRGKRYRK